MRKTKYVILRPGATSGEPGEVDWPTEPGLKLIHALVDPLLGEGEPLEHVSVLFEDRRADMFVSEMGHMKLTTREPLPRNDLATDVYRAAWLQQNPGTDPESLPTIAGVAVVFKRIVWT